jgi:DNA-directed RNA polymerase specialized sigma24 family protein
MADHLTQPSAEIVQAYFDQHRLSPDHKAILDAFNEGAEYGAIAVAMNLKVGTVKSRLNRARGKIIRLQIEDAKVAPAQPEAADGRSSV